MLLLIVRIGAQPVVPLAAKAQMCDFRGGTRVLWAAVS